MSVDACAYKAKKFGATEFCIHQHNCYFTDAPLLEILADAEAVQSDTCDAATGKGMYMSQISSACLWYVFFLS
jgi:hypothetical protein